MVGVGRGAGAIKVEGSSGLCVLSAMCRPSELAGIGISGSCCGSQSKQTPFVLSVMLRMVTDARFRDQEDGGRVKNEADAPQGRLSRVMTTSRFSKRDAVTSSTRRTC